MKAQWRDKDWSKSKYPERRSHYLLYKELVLDGQVIGMIEQFTTNPECFYANTVNDRSGCVRTEDWARQFVETKTGNKVN